ncbi:calcineurin-like phosphoesterase superfamily domain protein [Desulfosporosinus acididurans]|uniref:Calcineurin-like phosphoesterase superfamily domain protein n=1 Tax=Desulfosporosinus acididurans TaxID=476652 RepID=A0A0J1FWL9_9FIRM|nr:metallophosphoesterase [Desulfosporosinus acididurans]KLU67697.1 calcineurin-like phosphoesterase superfamily domain protein [Desulfosporosinus acididurans]
MDKLERISMIFQTAEEILFDNSSKIILMSDIHRGDGSWADDFSKNQNVYYAALNHYYHENYTYIEVGDGDELWKNNKLTDIINIHNDTFLLLSKFYNEGRLYMIWGNHDIVKQSENYVFNNLYQYFDEQEKKFIPLFKDLKLHEGLILRYQETNQKILLIHGHQVNIMDYELWRLSRFLVRYLWKHLELFGMNDPTSTAKNYEKKEDVDQVLIEWVKVNKHLLIAGHTHRPMFPDVGAPPYFNDGSCVHPRSITGIEINDGSIALVKWSVKTKDDGTLFIAKEFLEGPRKLSDFQYS